MIASVKKKIKWMNLLGSVLILSFVFLLVCRFFNISLHFTLVFLGVMLLLIYLSPFKRNLLYYVFFSLFYVLAYVAVYFSGSFIVIPLLLGSMLLFLFTMIYVRRKGFPGTIVESSRNYSIVFVDYDLFSFVKPGYYIVEGRLRKGTRVLIKSVEGNLSGLITKYEILRD